MKQTAIQWLFEKLWDTPKDKFDWYNFLNHAKEMEKQSQLDLIRFMRTSDKMGKSVEDLYNEFCD